MRVASHAKLGAGLAALLIGSVTSLTPARGGDEPGLLGRLFRGNNNTNTSKPASPPTTRPPASSPSYGGNPVTPPLLGSTTTPAGRSNSAQPPMPAASLPAANMPAANLASNNPGSSAPRIRPQPRNPSAATDAEPVLTRIALGRSDDGKQFGMFLQVFADGTVIDGEGVHKVGSDVMQPLLSALQAGELYRLHGHCGAAPTDFIEQVYVTVYQGRFGGVRSNTFSFTGNPQGCDPSVRQLHAAIEALVQKISPQAVPGPGPGSAPAPVATPAPSLGLGAATVPAPEASPLPPLGTPSPTYSASPAGIPSPAAPSLNLTPAP